MVDEYGRTLYVEGFLFAEGDVLLVRKNRPAWMAGLLNGIGGHIEAGETALEAMTRECEEESGVRVEDWEKFALLESGDFVVHFYRSFADTKPAIEQTTDEHVGWYEWRQLKPGETIPNLLWLLPMGYWEKEGRGMPYRIQENS